MLSLLNLKMKKHLNTLYITSDKAFVRKERETFIVEVTDDEGVSKKAFQARYIQSKILFASASNHLLRK